MSAALDVTAHLRMRAEQARLDRAQEAGVLHLKAALLAIATAGEGSFNSTVMTMRGIALHALNATPDTDPTKASE